MMVTMIFILKVEEEMIVPEKTLKKPRGVVDIGFFLVEEFETISEFDEFWKEHKFSKIYNHHMERACRIGSEDVFKCKYYSKTGYSQCKMHAKVAFRGYNNSVQFFLSNDSHTHVP